MQPTRKYQPTGAPDYWFNKYYNTKDKERGDPEPSEYWKACQERLKTWHKNRHSFDPVYMTDHFKEYRIKQKGPFWHVYAYRGGYINGKLKDRFMTFKQAEEFLIRFIKQHNKSGYARYPGCPKPQPTDFIGHLLKDWSPKPAP
jgi:hypothetical protein